MTTRSQALGVAGLTLLAVVQVCAATPDPRIREVSYDAAAVVSVFVKRGVVTHIVLGEDESISEVGSGQGGDCGKPESAWCIAAPAGGRHLFVKPKGEARGANNLAIVTDRRLHAFRLIVLTDQDARAPVYRLVVRTPVRRVALPIANASVPSPPSEPGSSPLPEPAPVMPTPSQVVAERLKAAPQVVNSAYSIAEGQSAADIVPTMVFDDGRFTYLKFPGQREIPAAFHVLEDGRETLVNTRMEDDLLVVDRVGRRLMLRAGDAVVGVWNDAYDMDGQPPAHGTTAPGVQRVLKRHEPTSANAPEPNGDTR